MLPQTLLELSSLQQLEKPRHLGVMATDDDGSYQFCAGKELGVVPIKRFLHQGVDFWIALAQFPRQEILASDDTLQVTEKQLGNRLHIIVDLNQALHQTDAGVCVVAKMSRPAASRPQGDIGRTFHPDLQAGVDGLCIARIGQRFHGMGQLRAPEIFQSLLLVWAETVAICQSVPDCLVILLPIGAPGAADQVGQSRQEGRLVVNAGNCGIPAGLIPLGLVSFHVVIPPLPDASGEKCKTQKGQLGAFLDGQAAVQLPQLDAVQEDANQSILPALYGVGYSIFLTNLTV